MLIDRQFVKALTGVEAEIDAERYLRECDALVYEESLYEFLRAAWKYIDPSPLMDNWHLGAIAEHLQAVCDGEISRLIVNQPPRTSKSSLLVAFDPWVWAQPHKSDTSGPGVQFLHTSYAQTLSIRDSVKTRRLLESPWYQKLWGDRFSVTSDQNTKIRFDNTEGGYRLATSVGGALTGEGGSIIVVMQRLHEDDLTGHILSSDLGNDWVHLMLPMRYEVERARLLYPNAIGWSDPRTEEGELLAPDRFDEASVRRLEIQLGPYGSAGQLQQRPEPKGGGILKRDFWVPWKHETYPQFDYVLASIDTAYTEKQENDYSAMTVWGLFKDDHDVTRVMLVNAWQERLDLHNLVLRIGKTAKRFGVHHMIIENKAAGISTAQEIRRIFHYEDWGIQLVDPKNADKIARAYAIQPLMADGNVYAPLDFSWADMVVTQCASFPKAKHDDLVDTVTAALKFFRETGMLRRAEERTSDLAENALFRGNSGEKPLYPV